MKPLILVGGSMCNPPHMGHYLVKWFLLQMINPHRLIWIPSGFREKDGVDKVGSEHRAEMAMRHVFRLRLMYGVKFELELADVYGRNTPTFQWIKKLREIYPEKDFDLGWYTGSDSFFLKPGQNECEIVRDWYKGRELFESVKFFVLSRGGYPPFEERERYQFPKEENLTLLDWNIPDISSSFIRECLSKSLDASGSLVPEVWEYIKSNNLYV